MRGGAYQAVQARLAFSESSGDPSYLLEPQASAELAMLRSAIGWPSFAAPPPAEVIRRELDAILLAGRFALTRYHLLPGADRLDGLLQAIELFAAVYPLTPGSVPAQVAAICAAISDVNGMDHAALHNDALDMLDGALEQQDLETVDQAIWQLAASVLAARDDPAEPYYLSSLGTAWMDRFKITGRAADVDNAITAHQRALAVTAPRPEDRAGRLANYGSALLARFELNGDMPDLDQALTTGRAAADLARRTYCGLKAGTADHNRAAAVSRALEVSLTSLGGALLASFEYRRDWRDLDEAVQLSREVVDSASPGNPARAFQRANLAHVLLERFSRFWQVADLKEAFDAARAAAGAIPVGELARAPALSALASAYANRFAYAGELGDLDEAISIGRQAVAAAPDNHPGQVGCLSNLGIALHRRFEHVGDTRALDEAIAMQRRAVQATPAGPRRARFLNNLGNALRVRFTVANKRDDIHDSVTVLGEAVAIAGRDETGRAGCVANLALSLVAVSEVGEDPATLEQAISILEREADTLGEDHPLRHVYYASLGNTWRAKWDTSSEEKALTNAIIWSERAVDALPGDHPLRAENLTSLGALLMRQFERNGDEEAGHKAVKASKSAVAITTAPVVTRALAARNWGQVAAGLDDAHEAMEGFAAAVNLLDNVAWRGLGRGDQERQLGRFVALASDAAAWAITAGLPHRAVELLEQGRGVLIAQSLDKRARYHDLAVAAPELAASLASTDEVLQRLSAADDPLSPDSDVLARRRAELTSHRDSLLRQIRQLPGLEEFLRPPEFANLQNAAAGGPLIILNVSRYRCDALTVTASGVTVTTLAGLTGADVVQHAADFTAALRELQESGTEEGTIAATLAWLWDKIVLPVMPDLRDAAATYSDNGGLRPRIWWCPTGPLTFLPIHAAGNHDRPGEALIDWFTSSYAPTVRLLQQARQNAARRPDSGRPLLVALPVTPGKPDLPAAAQEADSFARRFTDAMQLRGPDATARAVAEALTECPQWAHFACHGIQDISNPSAGFLALHDGPLAIGEISGLRLQKTELAFLSACETSRGGVELADEAITLATAFGLAGYQHVIGTLWSISDELAPDIADHVYQALTQPGRSGIHAEKTAAALDTAVLAARQYCEGEPWLWAPYIHIGP